MRAIDLQLCSQGVDIDARVSELGRQPYTTRKFFLKYQDRIMFGTDTTPKRDAYRVYYRAHLDGLHGNGADYSIDHTGNVYLMSPEGKFVAYYSPGILPDELAADLMKETLTSR